MPVSLSPLHDELWHVSDALDVLLAEMGNGRPCQRAHDDHVDRVEVLAARMVRAARGSGRPENPPLASHGSGYIW